MKYLLYVLFIILISNTAQAQLEKGKKLVGVQTNLVAGDSYNTGLSLSSDQYESGFGLNIVPTYGWVLAHNWIIGTQTTIGFARESHKLNGYESNYTYWDLGIAPFTRLYVDITKNNKWKAFGMAAIEIVENKVRYSIKGQNSPVSATSHTNVLGTLGGGFAYFGRTVVIDLSICNAGLRLGLYKTMP